MTDDRPALGTMRVQFLPEVMGSASLELVPEGVPFVDASTQMCNSESAAQHTVDLLNSDGIAPCVVIMGKDVFHAGVFYDPEVFDDADAERELWNVWQRKVLH
jgi:hypothetical protein